MKSRRLRFLNYCVLKCGSDLRHLRGFLGQSMKGGLNPLIPKSDQHQISLCDIIASQNRVVMRITDTITQDEFA